MILFLIPLFFDKYLEAAGKLKPAFTNSSRSFFNSEVLYFTSVDLMIPFITIVISPITSLPSKKLIALEKGEIQYRERCNDVRNLKLQLRDIKRQLDIRISQCNNMESLKNEVHHLQRELLQERTKVKALSEELENPINVHRWRKLSGSDPDSFEMISKIQNI